jgi:DNA-binding beta-propeller fold protein YncE
MNCPAIFGKSLLVCVLGLIMAGCATEQPKYRYVWPRLPERPRIEWLGAYQSERDLPNPSFVTSVLLEEARYLDEPFYIATDGEGKVYVGDMKLPGVMVFDFNKSKTHIMAEDYEKRPLSPAGVALDEEGNIYVADAYLKCIFVYDRNERQKEILDLDVLKVNGIGALTIDAKRHRILVPDIRGGHRILVLDYHGKLLLTIGERGLDKGTFTYPTAVAIDKEGNYLVCDQMNARIQRFTPEGKFLSMFGERGDSKGEFALPKAVAVDSEGHVYVTDGKNHKVGIYDVNGQFLLDLGGPYTFDGRKTNPGGFHTPQGIVIDKHDKIYVVDSMNRRFQIFQYLNDSYYEKHPLTEKDQAPK